MVLYWIGRKLVSTAVKTTLLGGFAAGAAVFATPDIKWTDQYAGTPLQKAFNGQYTLLDAALCRVPLNQFGSIARSRSGTDMSAAELLVCQRIVLADHLRTSMLGQFFFGLSNWCSERAETSAHSTEQKVLNFLSRQFLTVSSSVDPAPLNARLGGSFKKYGSETELLAAIAAKKLQVGDKIDHIQVLHTGEPTGVMLADNTFSMHTASSPQGAGPACLEVQTWIGCTPAPDDRRDVIVKLGQAYKVNSVFGYVMLPPVALYYFILNRFRFEAGLDFKTK
jgi:hypothetical protein